MKGTAAPHFIPPLNEVPGEIALACLLLMDWTSQALEAFLGCWRSWRYWENWCWWQLEESSPKQKNTSQRKSL